MPSSALRKIIERHGARIARTTQDGGLRIEARPQQTALPHELSAAGFAPYYLGRHWTAVRDGNGAEQVDTWVIRTES
jgi:hypothetical protein